MDMDMHAVLTYLQHEDAERRLHDDLSAGEVMLVSRGTSDKAPYGVADYSKCILARDSRCFVNETILYLSYHCFVCSSYNIRHGWEAQNLHLVCGSLGFGIESPRWFEHGKATYATVTDFTGGKPSDWDWHCWAEDEAGCVYDVVLEGWWLVSAVHKKRIALPPKSVIAGKEKSWLVSRGLEYVAAPLETQRILLAMMQRRMAPYLKKIGALQ